MKHQQTYYARTFCLYFIFLIIGMIPASAYAREVTLQWNPNAEPEVTGYMVYYDSSAGAPYEGSLADQGASPIALPLSALADPAAPQVTLTGLDENSDYFFAVTAYSAEAESGYSNEVSIETDQPLLAEAGPDQTATEGATVVLNGSNSADADDAITAYAWTQIEGTGVNLSNAAAVSPSFTTPDVGPTGETLVFRLLVTNGSGHTATDTVAVNVTWQNIPPTADAGDDQTVDEGETVILDASQSYDFDDGLAGYAWTQTAGPSVALSSSTAQRPRFTAPPVGPEGTALTFQLTVTDNNGLKDTDRTTVNVTWENIPPTADAGEDQTVLEGRTVTLDASLSSDVDNGVAGYAWTQTEGPAVTLSDSSAVQPTFVTPAVDAAGGFLVFELRVTDGGGLQANDEVVITVSDNQITDFPESVLALTTKTGDNIGIAVSGGSLVALRSMELADLPETSDEPDRLIFGLLDIAIKTDVFGGTAEMTVYLSRPAAEEYTWFNYDAAEGWTDCSDLAVFNDDRDRLTITLTDGGFGDDDDTVNGFIKDPAGLGTQTDAAAVPDTTNSSSKSAGSSAGGGGCFIRSVFPRGSGI